MRDAELDVSIDALAEPMFPIEMSASVMAASPIVAKEISAFVVLTSVADNVLTTATPLLTYRTLPEPGNLRMPDTVSFPPTVTFPFAETLPV